MLKKNELKRLLLLYVIEILVAIILSGCAGNGKTTTGLLFKPIPDTANLVFLSNRDTGSNLFVVYSSDEQGENITRITISDEQHFLVGIDKSIRYLAVTRGSESKKRIWILDRDTRAEIPLTGPEDNAEGRSFSPDSEWLVFWMVRSGETNSDIYKIRIDGSGLTNLTNTPNIQEFDPAWSNGGDEIAFISNEEHHDRFALKVMKSDGSNMRTIYDPSDSVNTSRFSAGVYDPSWSPDDSLILVEMPVRFTGNGENGGAGVWHIIEISYNGNNIHNLTASGEYSNCALYTPCFSPDGAWIFFSDRQGGKDAASVSIQIIKMDIDNQYYHAITDKSYWAQAPVWIR